MTTKHTKAASNSTAASNNDQKRQKWGGGGAQQIQPSRDTQPAAGVATGRLRKEMIFLFSSPGNLSSTFRFVCQLLDHFAYNPMSSGKQCLLDHFAYTPVSASK